jgi:hypothetical protein
MQNACRMTLKEAEIALPATRSVAVLAVLVAGGVLHKHSRSSSSLFSQT